VCARVSVCVLTFSPLSSSPPLLSSSPLFISLNTHTHTDDLERILGYVPIGPQFSNVVLQTLLVLIKARPPPGRRLLVVATTSRARSLEALELTQAFQMQTEMPELSSVSEVKEVVSTWADQKSISITDETLSAFAGHFSEEAAIPMKRLLVRFFSLSLNTTLYNI
jgi:hypothetical protein